VLKAIKKPRTFAGGASGEDMRPLDYARTPPEPRQGLVVLVVVFAVSVMAQTYAGEICARQRGPDAKKRLKRVESGMAVTQ
jgi:hypothetical protein